MRYLYREIHPDKPPCVVVEADSIREAAICGASRSFAKIGDVFDVGHESAWTGESPWYRYRITREASEYLPPILEQVDPTSTPEQSPKRITLEFSGVRITIETQEAE